MTAIWIDLPAAATDFRRGDLGAVWIPAVLPRDHEAALWVRLWEWDALVGRMVRASLFDDTADREQLRRDVEEVAACVERLAVRLGGPR